MMLPLFLLLVTSPVLSLRDSVPQVGAVTWSAEGGRMDPNGTYTAGDVAGSFRIVASAEGGKFADTASVTVTAALGPSGLNWRDLADACALSPIIGLRCEKPTGKGGKTAADQQPDEPIVRRQIGFDQSLLRRGIACLLEAVGLALGLWLSSAGGWGVYRDEKATFA